MSQKQENLHFFDISSKWVENGEKVLKYYNSFHGMKQNDFLNFPKISYQIKGKLSYEMVALFI